MTCLPQPMPRFLSIRIAEVQQRCGRARHWGQRKDSPAVRAEVPRPLVSSRIEERYDMLRLGVQRSDIGSLEPVALNACQGKVFEVGLPTVLSGDNVVGLVSKERADLGHPAVFAATPGPFTNGGSEPGGNPRLAHAADERRANTSALMSETNRSTSHSSSNSASSSGVNAPSWLRLRSSCARAEARSDGLNSMISSSAGRRARNEITSRRRPEFPNHVRRSPRAIISGSRSRSGSSCLASFSGISMVICMSRRVAHLAGRVKPREEPPKRPAPHTADRFVEATFVPYFPPMTPSIRHSTASS